MKKFLMLMIMFLGLLVPLKAQVDQTKWYIMDDYGTTYCWNNPQATVTGGYLYLTTIYGLAAFSCQGHTPNYQAGAVISNPFYFQYGTIKVRAKSATTGVHAGIIWLWGGASNSSGYPPTCVPNIIAHTGAPFAECTTNSIPSYEVDVAEMQPNAGYGLDGIGNYVHIWQNASITTTYGRQANWGSDLTAAFHVYELDWNSTTLTFKVDGTTTTTVTYALAVPMFLIMDQEIDSSAPPETSGYYPNVSQYDYVRVCSSPTATCNVGDPTMIFDDEFIGINVITSGKVKFAGKVKWQ
jgi:beta-glucanase (GH16 family)